MADKIKPKTKIAIIGAGIAGPVFALTILSHPTLSSLYEPILFDKLPPPAQLSSNPSNSRSQATYAAGAAVALTSNALFPLYSLGLRESLDAISCETTEIKIWRAWQDGTHQYYNKILNPNWQADLETNMRVVERKDLQGLLISKIEELGGEVRWGRKLMDIDSYDSGGLKMWLQNGAETESEEVGLLVGADGAWSSVRKHIITKAYGSIGEEKWKPGFAGAGVIYGVSRPIIPSSSNSEIVKDGDTHAVLLDNGIASTWSLPGGRQFVTIAFSSPAGPQLPSRNIVPSLRESKPYGSEISLGGYSLESTETILKSHEHTFHPIAGNFGEIFRGSERIVRTPLYYQVWEADEIGNRNCICIGDAGRLMLPSSGQGACFAIEDAVILANALLNNAPRDGDFSTVVGEYTRERLPRSRSIAKQSYWTGLISVGDRWWWRWARDLGSKWMPMGGDPKGNENAGKQDPMGWIYDERFKVELRVRGES